MLGPVGLLAWLISARSHRMGALVEVVGDLPPYVFGMVIALLVVILVPSVGQDNRLLLLSFYGLHFTLVLFLYQAPLLALFWILRRTGSQPSLTENINCRINPNQKTGMAIPRKDKPVPMKSNRLY